MKVNSTYIRVLASSLSNTSGIKVEEGPYWAFDMDKKKLIYNPVTLLEKSVDAVRGTLLHEIGHVLFTKTVESSNIYKKYPSINLVYNAVEDIRIEQKLNRMYGDFSFGGLVANSVAGVELYLTPDHLKQHSKSVQIGKTILFKRTLEELKMGGFSQGGLYLGVNSYGQVYNSDYHNRNSDPELILSRAMEHDQKNNGKSPLLDEDVAEAIGVIEKKVGFRNITKMAKMMGSFEEVQKYVDKKIFPHIKHLLENDPENEKQKNGGQERGGDGENGVQAVGATGKGDAQQAGVNANGMSVEPGEGNMANFKMSSKVPPYNEASAMVRPYSNFLASRIKDILKENTAINFHGNHRSGRLLSRNVTKLVMGEERVFSKRNQIDSPNHHLIIALDASGSMQGEREYNAYLGTVLALDTFKKVRMKFTIFEFGDDTKILATDKYVNPHFLNYSSQGGGTDDGYMIKTVADYMKKNPNDEFLFIIIGDGQGGRLPDNELDYIDRRGYAMAIGIGEGARSVERQYRNGIAVEDVTKVPQVILNQLHAYIHR